MDNIEELLDEAEKLINENDGRTEALYRKMIAPIQRDIRKRGLPALSTAISATTSVLIRLLSFMPAHVREAVLDGFEDDVLESAQKEGGDNGIAGDTGSPRKSSKSEFDAFLKAFNARQRKKMH